MIPSAAEQAVYDADVKEVESRLAVVVSRPFWTAQVQDLFGGSSLDQTLWKSTIPEPEVSGGSLNIKAYGQPPHEVVLSRPLWFPTNDLTLGFEVTINATFPQTNPGYTTLIALGGLEGGRAKIADAMRIYQVGENSLISGVSPGDIVVESGTFVGVAGHTFANDQMSHEYKFTWDPDALDPFESGSARITIEVDSVVEIEITDPQETREVIQQTNTVRPFFIQIGTQNDFDTDAQAQVPGTPSAGVNILEVEDVTVDQLGAEGFETETFPGWTTANAGGNLDTAELGERFDLDGETWAKLPNVVDWSVERGRERESDSFRVRITGGDPDDPDSDPNIFQGDHWLRRPIIIDTRVLDESGTATAWKRQIAGVIEDARPEVGDDGEVNIILTGRDRPTVKLDTFVSGSYIGSGTIDAVNVGLTTPQILEDIVDIGDNLYDGDALGATDTDIHASTDLTPEALTAGGASLLQAMTNLAEEIGLEFWKRYAVTGTGRYGEIVIQRFNEGLQADHLNSEGRAWSMTADREPPDGVGGDAYWQTGGATGFFPGNDELRLGENPAGTFHHLFLYIPWTRIPPGANIVSAFIGFDARGAGGGVTFETDISANDTDDPTLPTTQAAAEGLTLTTASVAWDGTASWADNDVVRTPDFAAVIQEVIDRPGYEAGNPLLVVIRTDTASGVFDFSSNSITSGGSFIGPRLIIEFDEGARYTFRGRGATSGRTNVAGLALHETSRDGVGQIVVAADNMIQTESVFSGGEPGPANFPRAPYPPAAPELRSSLSESGLFFTLPTVRFDDINDARRRGGPQMGRWHRMTSLRRTLSAQLHAHDWLDPSDEVGFDDPDHLGLDDTETWVVDSLAMTLREGTLRTEIELVTTDLLRAITRGL